MDTDSMIRIKALDWLADQVHVHGDVLPRELLQGGLEFQGHGPAHLVPGHLVAEIMDHPLSITTSPNSPYADAFVEQDFLRYRYRGADPHHRDNTELREMFRRGLTLVYLYDVLPGRYVSVWPVYIVGDDPATLAFKINADDVVSVLVQAIRQTRLREGTGRGAPTSRRRRGTGSNIVPSASGCWKRTAHSVPAVGCGIAICSTRGTLFRTVI